MKRKESGNEWFIRQIVEGDSQLDGATISQMANQLGIRLGDTGLYCVAVRYADCKNSFSDANKLIALYNAAVASGKTLGNTVYCYTGPHLYTVMLIEKIRGDNSQTVEKLYSGISRRVSEAIQIGVGRSYTDVEKLSYSKVEAYEALDSLKSDGKIAYVEDIYVRHNLTTRKLEREKRKILESFRAGNLQQLRSDTENLVEVVRKESPIREGKPYPTSIRRTIVELLVEIMHISSDAGVNVDEVLGHQDPYRIVFDKQDTPGVLACFDEVVTLLSEKVMEQYSISESNMLLLAREFIDQHINDPTLSLSLVSESLCITSAYFSAFFIHEVGVGFNEYVTNLRIEQAKCLLDESNMKINMIAEKCGFRSSSYFIVVFRKKMGMSPGEYRNRRK